MQRSLIVTLAFLVTAPVAALAQRGAAPPFDGPRGFYTFDLADGEPISFFLEVSHELALSENQRRHLMDIRRRLRETNAPFVARLDSLRSLAGIDLGDRNGINRKDAEALERFNRWARPSIDAMRVNNDVARSDARRVLDSDQRRRLDSIARDDEARMRTERRRRGARTGPDARIDVRPPA
jgi:hypothetical protein